MCVCLGNNVVDNLLLCTDVCVFDDIYRNMKYVFILPYDICAAKCFFSQIFKFSFVLKFLSFGSHLCGNLENGGDTIFM